MSGLRCPRCGHGHDAPVVDRQADAFCSSCDYPLFFVPSPPPPDVPEQVAPEAPTAPAPVVAPPVFRPCPACMEPNEADGVFCRRCGHALDADPGPLFDPDPATFPPPPTSSSGAFVLSLLALLVALAALVVALFL